MNIKINNDGFTIIEVLFAIMIFSIGMLAVASMQITSISGNDRANIGTEATVIAGDMLDELMTMNYAPLGAPPPVYPLFDQDGDGVAGLLDEDAAADHTTIPPGTQGNYTVFWNVADNAPSPNMKRISVIVRWSGGDGRQHRVVMNSIKPLVGG